jgi:hypothetical protein
MTTQEEKICQKKRCADCGKLFSFERFYCKAVDESLGMSREHLNKDGDCRYYKPARWRFWLYLMADKGLKEGG